jgi:hypothetical protein
LTALLHWCADLVIPATLTYFISKYISLLEYVFVK